MRTQLPRTGASLVEIIVVIALLGLLLSIATPAVLGAREAARRTQCKCNLKNVGIALANYFDALGSSFLVVSLLIVPVVAPLLIFVGFSEGRALLDGKVFSNKLFNLILIRRGGRGVREIV